MNGYTASYHQFKIILSSSHHTRQLTLLMKKKVTNVTIACVVKAGLKSDIAMSIVPTNEHYSVSLDVHVGQC